MVTFDTGVTTTGMTSDVWFVNRLVNIYWYLIAAQCLWKRIFGYVDKAQLSLLKSMRMVSREIGSWNGFDWKLDRRVKMSPSGYVVPLAGVLL